MARFLNCPRTTIFIPTAFLLNLHLLLTFLLSTHFRLTRAQDAPIYFNPIPVSAPAYARATTHLYVVSGAAASNPGLRIPQFLALDLNVPWNTTSPAWSKHADGGPMQDLFPAAFSADEKILYTFHADKSSSPMQWDSETEVWMSVTNVKFENATWQGIGAVTDPRTGLIYLAGGYNDDSNLGNNPLFLAMDVFDPVSQTVNRTHFWLPPTTFLATRYYGNVWCKTRSSILYWGGNAYQSDPSTQLVSEFKVDTQDWSVMVTTGPTPPMRADHCMAANEDGTKVVIYGGRLYKGAVVGDVSVLDITTKTWTTGVSGQPRMYVACTVAGDQLLIWGGKAADNLAPPPDLIIYNFVTRIWTTQYTPPEFYKNLKIPGPLNRTTAPWPIVSQRENGVSGSGMSGGVSAGGIVGSVLAGVVLIAAGVGFFVLRRRRQGQGQGEGRRGGDPTQDEKEGGEGGLFEAWANGESGLAVLKRQAQTRVFRKLPSKGNKEEHDSSPSAAADGSHESELQQTLRELQELENQQQELEKKRELLVLQQQEQQGGVQYPLPPPLTLNVVTSGDQLLRRGPMEYVETPSEYRPPPNNPEYIAPMFSALRSFVELDGGPGGPGSSISNGGIGGGVAGSNRRNERRTVQDTTEMGISSNMGSWVRSPLHPHANVMGYSGRARQHSRAMSM